MRSVGVRACVFFCYDTATTEIYTLSLHDALPICGGRDRAGGRALSPGLAVVRRRRLHHQPRSEEHTSELQSHVNLVCRLLLEKKKNTTKDHTSRTPRVVRNVAYRHRSHRRSPV